MPPTTSLADFLAFLATSGGLSAATAAVIAGVLWLAAQGGRVLTNNQKRGIAAVVPFVLVLGALTLQSALAYVPWNIDNFFQGAVLAVELVAGSQAVYQGVRAISEATAPEPPPPAPPAVHILPDALR